MAGGITSIRGSGGVGRTALSPDFSGEKFWQNLTWISIGLGSAAFMAGLGGRRGTLPLAVTALAGAVALDQMRAGQRGDGRTPGKDRRSLPGEAEIERSITIGKPADELRRSWQDARTLPEIMAAFATVRATGDGHTHWTVEGPLGRAYEWEAEIVDARPDGGIGWRSLPGAAIPNEGSIRFRPAPADRGTVTTLQLSFVPPGGALGEAAVELLGSMHLKLAGDAVLRRFKSLVETGEIPTTERQPAARADTR